jgi:hypothetical protein
MSAAAPTAWAQTSALDQAEALYNEGAKLFRDGKYNEAAAQFLAAYNVKPFPLLLLNAGIAYEKLGDKQKAIQYLEEYLTKEPKGRDRKDVEQRIARLKGTGKVDPSAPTPPPAETKIKGIVFIESKPPGATIYLNDKNAEPLGETPWSGSLEGTNTIIIESKGYKTEKKTISPSGNTLYHLDVVLSQEFYLGWLEIRSNIPGADVYIDDRNGGSVGRTPFMGNVTPGPHTIIVTREGYTESEHKIEIEAGKAHRIDTKLEKAPIGFVQVSGFSVEGARVLLDGKLQCLAPCRFQAPEGDHKLDVEKKGLKTYSRELKVVKATQTNLTVKLVPKPGRGDVIWKFTFAGLFLTGGVILGLQANSVYNKIQDDIDAGMPPVQPDDSRFLRGKIFTWSADACFVIGGVTAVFGVISLLQDRGPPSTGVAESRELGWTPVIFPGGAGISAGGTF